MELPIEILCYGIAVPGAIAFGAVWIGLRHGWNLTLAHRIFGIAVAAAFFAGCAFLLGQAVVLPTRHWQWLPCASLLAGMAGAFVPSKLQAKDWRWGMLAALAIVTAWLIVPTRPTLWPARPSSIALLSVYLFAIMAILSVLPEQLLGKAFLAQLAITAGTLALLLASEISFTFGQLGIAVAAGLSGAWAASWFANSPAVVRSVIPAFVVMSGGLAYIGCIGRDPPLFALPVVAAAPLALWICAKGPLSRLRGALAGVVQTAVVLAPIVIAVLWTLLSSEYEY